MDYLFLVVFCEIGQIDFWGSFHGESNRCVDWKTMPLRNKLMICVNFFLGGGYPYFINGIWTAFHSFYVLLPGFAAINLCHWQREYTSWTI